MDSKKVRLLLRAVESGSMMKIAEEEGYTPSGLTHMMTALEQELGMKLLVRNNQGISLTYEGELLSPFLKRFIAAENKIRAEIARIQSASDTVIRVGTYPSVAKNWMPGIMRDFAELYPDITIELCTLIRPEAYTALDLGKLDVILVGKNEGSEFRFTPLVKDQYYAILPPALAGELGWEKFPIECLSDFPFIMPSYNTDTAVEEILSSHNVKPKSLAVVADYQTIISMVSSGFGISILAELVFRGSTNSFCAIPLSPPSFRTIGIVTRPLKELSATKKAFIMFVKDRFIY